MNEFAQRLLRLRQRHDLTQAKLAKIAGVSQAVISRAERGLGDLPREAIDRILQALGADASKLLAAHQTAQPIDAIAEAWDRYDEVVFDTSVLIQDISTVLRRLRSLVGDPNWFEDPGVKQYLEPAYMERVSARRPPTSDRLPGAQAARAIRRPSSYGTVIELLTHVEQLSDTDLEFIVQLARRLVGEYTSPKQAVSVAHRLEGGAQ